MAPSRVKIFLFGAIACLSMTVCLSEYPQNDETVFSVGPSSDKNPLSRASFFSRVSNLMWTATGKRYEDPVIHMFGEGDANEKIDLLLPGQELNGEKVSSFWAAKPPLEQYAPTQSPSSTSPSLAPPSPVPNSPPLVTPTPSPSAEFPSPLPPSASISPPLPLPPSIPPPSSNSPSPTSFPPSTVPSSTPHPFSPLPPSPITPSPYLPPPIFPPSVSPPINPPSVLPPSFPPFPSVSPPTFPPSASPSPFVSPPILPPSSSSSPSLPPTVFPPLPPQPPSQSPSPSSSPSPSPSPSTSPSPSPTPSPVPTSLSPSPTPSVTPPQPSPLPTPTPSPFPTPLSPTPSPAPTPSSPSPTPTPSPSPTPSSPTSSPSPTPTPSPVPTPWKISILTNLIVLNGETLVPDFNPFVFSYNVSFDSKVRRFLVVAYLPEDEEDYENSSLHIDSVPLKSGENSPPLKLGKRGETVTYHIYVRADNHAPTTYVLSVTREAGHKGLGTVALIFVVLACMVGALILLVLGYAGYLYARTGRMLQLRDFKFSRGRDSSLYAPLIASGVTNDDGRL